MSKSAKSEILYGGHNFENLQSIYENALEEHFENAEFSCLTNEFLARQSDAHYNLTTIQIENINGNWSYSQNIFTLYLNGVDTIHSLEISGITNTVKLAGEVKVEKITISGKVDFVKMDQLRLDCDVELTALTNYKPSIIHPSMLNSHKFTMIYNGETYT